MSRELDITNIDGRRVLWVESERICEYLSAYKAGTFSALGINTARGYHKHDITFLENCDFVDAIEVVPGIVPMSLQPLRALKALRSLIVSADCSELALGDFPELEEFRGYWHPGLLSAHGRLRTLDLSNYKARSKDLTSLPSLPRLRQLCLVQANLASLLGVARFCELERLELTGLSRLRDLNDLELLAKLEWLECAKCRALENVEAVVPRVEQLRVLRLNACAPLSSLRFLDALPHLEEFRFVNTDVIDGDLTPLIRLRRVGFLGKTHFSHTPEQIDALIAKASASADHARIRRSP